jgi:hypothetical protein
MMVPSTSKPTATLTIEPTGMRPAAGREHSIHLILSLSANDAKHGDKAHVTRVARSVLAGFQSETDMRFCELSAARRSAKPGAPGAVVTGIEGFSVWQGRPSDQSVEGVRAALVAEGYRVSVREKRECAEPGCKAFVQIGWGQQQDVPPRWYSSTICGDHNYRTCARCKSAYLLTSTNAAGQAPSVHCEVCGLVLVEWGASKIWTATLVTRG